MTVCVQRARRDVHRSLEGLLAQGTVASSRSTAALHASNKVSLKVSMWWALYSANLSMNAVLPEWDLEKSTCSAVQNDFSH